MPGPDLTARELEVLRGVATGLTYRQLAARWGIAEITVRGYGHRLMAKLGAASMPNAVLLACQAGLLDGRPRRHGDHAGYAAHVYRGETPCDDCEAGEKAYKAEWRARRKAAKTQQQEAA